MTKTLSGKSGSIDLLKLEKAREATMSGELGVFIPYSPNKIYAKNGKSYLNLMLRPLQEPMYGNDYMCSRSRTEEEGKEGKQLPILGNFKDINYFVSREEQDAREVSAASPVEPNYNQSSSSIDDDEDMPF